MLADYIIALLKHDKENDELKELCVSQLEDFLQSGKLPRHHFLFSKRLVDHQLCLTHV